MRTGVAVLVAAVALVVLPAASGSRSSSPLLPSAVAFSDRLHGELAFASPHCDGCRPRGAIAVTSDGGKTWHIVRHTDGRVVKLAFFHDVYYAELESGRLISGQPGSRNVFKSYCPKGWTAGTSADIVDTNIGKPWSICVGQPGAGNQAKAVYRGTERVAFTPPASHGGYGGISTYGYPNGIAGTYGGFGLIWESRGTLYVTRDGGHHWHALPKVARPEVDFGAWADVNPGNGTGFVLLSYNLGTSEGYRLIETTDAGRTWHVVHRWRFRLS